MARILVSMPDEFLSKIDQRTRKRSFKKLYKKNKIAKPSKSFEQR